MPASTGCAGLHGSLMLSLDLLLCMKDSTYVTCKVISQGGATYLDGVAEPDGRL